jgi:FkbM family methyltransferase
MFKPLKNKFTVIMRSLFNYYKEQEFIKRDNFSISKNHQSFKVKNADFDFTLRRKGSDWSVFKQVFQYQEYKSLVKTLHLNQVEPTVILDLGANIGLTTLYFKKFFPNAEVICLEPDRNNFAQLSLNTAPLSKVKLINAAVWNKGASLMEDNTFRGGDDWSKSYKEENKDVPSTQIEGITIQDILKQSDKNHIDVLKIDIEGAERFIFNESISDLSFLSVTRVIALEIHDEFNIRETINQILQNYGFNLFEAGELTIGIRK